MRKINLTTAEYVYIVTRYNELKDEFNCMKTWDKWKLSKIIRKLEPIANEFTDFKNEQDISLTTEYASDDKSDSIIREVDGEKIPTRKIKPEFLADYQEKQVALIKDLEEVASKRTEVEIEELSIKEIFDYVPDDAFTQNAIELLSLIAE